MTARENPLHPRPNAPGPMVSDRVRLSGSSGTTPGSEPCLGKRLTRAETQQFAAPAAASRSGIRFRAAGSLLSATLLGLAVFSSTAADPSFWERLLSFVLLGLAVFIATITEPAFWKRLTGDPELPCTARSESPRATAGGVMARRGKQADERRALVSAPRYRDCP